MKRFEFLVTLVVLVAIGLTSFWAYRYEQRRAVSEICPFCDRMVHPATAYGLRVSDRIVVACCPRCAMHFQVNQVSGRPGLPVQAGRVGPAWATDVTTGERIVPENAIYIEGGDLQYCTRGEQPVTREPQGVSVRQYDRCLPTLVAFKTQQAARAYQQQHGGHILSYAQALAGVREQ
jgi:hypothetical protein